MDSGPVPLPVQFEASVDEDRDLLSYSWDFTGDGLPDAIGPTAFWTFDTPGEYVPQVTVTDETGATAVGSLTVTAGNTRPVITIEAPADGAWVEPGEAVPFRVKGTDAEDGPIDCTQILVAYQADHPLAEAAPGPDCTGVLPPTAEGHSHLLTATYTDAGSVTGAPPLTGQADAMLHPREIATDPIHTTASTHATDPTRAAALSVPRVNLAGIHHLAAQLAGTAGLTVHADSPTGPVVAAFPARPAADAHQWVAADVADPGGVHDLYLVPETPDLAVGLLRFQTVPKATAALTPAQPTGQNGWYTTDVALDVASTGGRYWSQQYSTDGATWTDAPALLTGEGAYDVGFRAVDVTGRASAPGAVPIRIDKTAPVVRAAAVSQGHTTAPVLGPLAQDAASGVAATTATLAGVPVDPAKPLELWRFPAGTHELTVTATDQAGHSSTGVVPFAITTSLPELTPLVTKYQLNWFVDVVLRLQLAAAEEAHAEGRAEDAVYWTRSFRNSLPLVGDEATRTILHGDATIVLSQLRR